MNDNYAQWKFIPETRQSNDIIQFKIKDNAFINV